VFFLGALDKPELLAMTLEFKNDFVNANMNDSIFSIVALSGEPLTDETVSSVLELTERVLVLGLHFKTLWDLRLVAVPPLLTIGRCIKWAWKNKARLDELNQKMLILLNADVNMIRVVNMVLSSFGPRCPTTLTSNESLGRSWLSGNQSSPPTDK
jgi:hypothetical protein